MKFLVLVLLSILSFSAFSQSAIPEHQKTNAATVNDTSNHQPDSVKLTVEVNYAYYQKTVKVDSVPEGIIYVRAMQFMAAKNFQQTYGYQEEGKLIFTTSQDLNMNAVYAGDENEVVNPYNVQFSIMLDLKNFRYRYTINNVVFFLPTDAGNKRETLLDIYQKSVSSEEPRRLQKLYRSIIESFERYISSVVTELRQSIEHKLPIYSSKF